MALRAVFRAGVVVPVGSGVFSWFTELLTPVDSCAAAHLTTVVLRRLVLRHGPRRWGSKSCLRRSQIVSFDLLRRDSKHSKRKSRTDLRLRLWVSPTPNLTAFRNGQSVSVFW